jgi:Rrf2 family protein
VYGKQTETAIAALACLAEVYDGGKTRLAAAQIAEKRSLQQPSVAKSLTTLSQARLVQGIPGPGGGYWLAKPPHEIALYDAFVLFERENTSMQCPFKGGECSNGDPCPIHAKLVKVQNAVADLLRNTTFGEFAPKDQQPITLTTSARSPLPAPPPAATKRESYRANLTGPTSADRR